MVLILQEQPVNIQLFTPTSSRILLFLSDPHVESSTVQSVVENTE